MEKKPHFQQGPDHHKTQNGKLCFEFALFRFFWFEIERVIDAFVSIGFD